MTAQATVTGVIGALGAVCGHLVCLAAAKAWEAYLARFGKKSRVESVRFSRRGAVDYSANLQFEKEEEQGEECRESAV